MAAKRKSSTGRKSTAPKSAAPKSTARKTKSSSTGDEPSGGSSRDMSGRRSGSSEARGGGRETGATGRGDERRHEVQGPGRHSASDFDVERGYPSRRSSGREDERSGGHHDQERSPDDRYSAGRDPGTSRSGREEPFRFARPRGEDADRKARSESDRRPADRSANEERSGDRFGRAESGRSDDRDEGGARLGERGEWRWHPARKRTPDDEGRLSDRSQSGAGRDSGSEDSFRSSRASSDTGAPRQADERGDDRGDKKRSPNRSAGRSTGGGGRSKR